MDHNGAKKKLTSSDIDKQIAKLRKRRDQLWNWEVNRAQVDELKEKLRSLDPWEDEAFRSLVKKTGDEAEAYEQWRAGFDPGVSDLELLDYEDELDQATEDIMEDIDRELRMGN